MCINLWTPSICRDNVEKTSVLENLDLVLLCLDEIVDGGYVPFGRIFIPSFGLYSDTTDVE